MKIENYIFFKKKEIGIRNNHLKNLNFNSFKR